MKYELIRQETGEALPPLKVTVEIKNTLLDYVNGPIVESIEHLRDRIYWILDMAKEQAPNFKRERWYLCIDPNTKTFTIRYGHYGEPQLIVKEAAV